MFNAIVAVPGEEVKVLNVSEGSKALNELVGGSLECILLGNGFMMYCNQDGNEMDLPANPHFAQGIIKGPFVIVKTGQDGNTAALSEADIEMVMNRFVRNAPAAVLR